MRISKRITRGSPGAFNGKAFVAGRSALKRTVTQRKYNWNGYLRSWLCGHWNNFCRSFSKLGECNMKKQVTFALALGSAIAAFVATPALADHNSPMGAGWANMPNDVHNTRIDTREADEDEDDEFIEFVKYGAGADTVNRFLTTTTSSASGTSSAISTAGGAKSTVAGSKP